MMQFHGTEITACKITIVVCNALMLASALLSGCLSDMCEYPTGTYECNDDGPVMHYELDGKWCDIESNTCLSVSLDPRQRTRYLWQVGLCFEHGTLTGGLEFSPDTDSRLCLPGVNEPALYSASGEFTATGLRLAVDHSNGTTEGVALTLKLERR